MTPALRTMPVVRCTLRRTGTVLVALPGGRTVEVVDEEHARRLVRAEAPGSSLLWDHETIPESELRALWGDK